MPQCGLQWTNHFCYVIVVEKNESATGINALVMDYKLQFGFIYRNIVFRVDCQSLRHLNLTLFLLSVISFPYLVSEQHYQAFFDLTNWYLKSLLLFQALLQNPDVLHEVDNPHHSNDDVLRDVLDGEFVQNHPIFAVQKDALIILGYFDDLEIANPLGSKAKVHKIGK